MKTLVGTPDRGDIRRARLEWVASSMLLPVGLLVQVLAAKRKKGNV